MSASNRPKNFNDWKWKNKTKNKQTWFTRRKNFGLFEKRKIVIENDFNPKQLFWSGVFVCFVFLENRLKVLLQEFCWGKSTFWTLRVHHLAIGIHSFALSCSLRCHDLKEVFGEVKAGVSAEWRERRMELQSFKLLIRIILRFIISKGAEIRNQQKRLNAGFFSQKALWVCRV